MTSDGAKKKIIIKKKKSEDKPAIRLNKPADEETLPDTQETVPPEQEAPVEAPQQDEPPEQKPKTFKFYCVYCGQKLGASETMIGRRISCPACGREVEVPAPPTD